MTPHRIVTPAYDAEFVLHRLREAGATLLMLPSNAPRLGCKTQGSLFASDADLAGAGASVAALAANPRANRQTRLEPAQIDRMDRTWRWLSLIPDDNRVIRRVVALRSLIKPGTDRHVMSWRDIGAQLRCNHEAARGWHNRGIDMIVDALNRGEEPSTKRMAA